jgi:hypothetical protein
MLDDRFPILSPYDRYYASLLDGRVRLRKILDHGGLPWTSVDAAKRALDALNVPYVELAKQRHYHVRDIEAAVAAAEVRPDSTAA